MSKQKSREQMLSHRAELMAQLFFEELNPTFMSQPTQDIGYDLLVGFQNKLGGINTFAVAVESTENLREKCFSVAEHKFLQIVRSNVPGILFVVDVKQNQIYYAWLSAAYESKSKAISIPLSELNAEAKKKLHEQFVSVNSPAKAI